MNAIDWRAGLETVDGVAVQLSPGDEQPDIDGDYYLEPIDGDLSRPTPHGMGWPLIVRPDGRHWILLDDAPIIRNRASG